MKVVQFISPQVWASRPKRADRMAGDYDLLLSIFPFEKDWYAKRVPVVAGGFCRASDGGTVCFGGDKFYEFPILSQKFRGTRPAGDSFMLPGSRRSELKHHLPAMRGALKLIREKIPSAQAKMVVPSKN